MPDSRWNIFELENWIIAQFISMICNFCLFFVCKLFGWNRGWNQDAMPLLLRLNFIPKYIGNCSIIACVKIFLLIDETPSNQLCVVVDGIFNKLKQSVRMFVDYYCMVDLLMMILLIILRVLIWTFNRIQLNHKIFAFFRQWWWKTNTFDWHLLFNFDLIDIR